MERAKALPAESRYKAFAPKCRLVAGSDVESAIGCGLPTAHVAMVTSLCATPLADSTQYAVVVSVALACGTNVVRGASYAAGGEGVRASVSETVADPAAPSVWALRLKHDPENPNPSEPWLFCLSRGRSRGRRCPPFNYAGPLRPAPIMTPERASPARGARGDPPAGLRRDRGPGFRDGEQAPAFQLRVRRGAAGDAARVLRGGARRAGRDGARRAPGRDHGGAGRHLPQVHRRARRVPLAAELLQLRSRAARP